MVLNIQYLLKQIAEEDSKKAFEKLYNLYVDKAFSFAMFILNSTQLAEEAVSDVFLKLWKNRESLPGIKNWNSFLYISIRNQSFNYLEQNSVKQTESLGSFVVDVAVENENPEDIFLKEELDEIIQNAVNNLPARCKMIYYMVQEEKLSYKQVAEILGLSERTINTQMTIAVKKIGVAIRPYLDYSNCKNSRQLKSFG